MVPVVWTADLLRFPADVEQVHFKKGTDPQKYIERGLSYLMQSPRRFGTQYDDLVDHLALDIARMAQAQGEARVRFGRPWNEIQPPFPATYKRGLGYVRFVFVAGRSDEMRSVRQARDAYGIYENRQDWRPCFPDVDRHAGDLARAVAAEAGKDFEFVEPKDLPARMAQAKALNNILAVIVDPWSMTLPFFDDFTQRLDVEQMPASGVIVTWNPKDPETSHELPVLKNKLSDRFRGRQRRQEYYNDTVSSPEAFYDALSAMFNTAQGHLVERGAIATASRETARSLPRVKQ